MSDVILEVRNLKKYFPTKKGQLHAVDDISFTLERGKTLGVVGESGCGKSTTGRAILRLQDPTSGQVLFQGKDITKFSTHEMRNLRTEMQMIFQDPFASLNPRKSVSEIIAAPLRLHKLCKNRQSVLHFFYKNSVYRHPFHRLKSSPSTSKRSKILPTICLVQSATVCG